MYGVLSSGGETKTQVQVTTNSYVIRGCLHTSFLIYKYNY